MVVWEVRLRAGRSAGALCQWRRCGRRADIDPQEQSLRAAVVDTLWRVSVTWVRAHHVLALSRDS